jgi:hypothetical protein
MNRDGQKDEIRAVAKTVKVLVMKKYEIDFFKLNIRFYFLTKIDMDEDRREFASKQKEVPLTEMVGGNTRFRASKLPDEDTELAFDRNCVEK